MPMVRAMRMLNAIEAGTLTGAQLQTLLTTDAGRLAELNVLLGLRGQCRRLAASSTAMAAVIASSTAMAAVAASSTAMAAVAASSTAMAAVNANDQAVRIWMLAGTAQVWSNFANVAAVAASSTAMAAVAASATAMSAVAASNIASDAVFTSAIARLAIYDNNTALAAYQANPTQVARQIGIGGRTVTASTAAHAFVFVPNGTRVILLRRWYSGTSEHDLINWARGSTTAAVGQGPVGGSRNLDTGVAALGTVPGNINYTSNGAHPGTNNDTANFVSAANGLQRRHWNDGFTLSVTYITV